MAHDFIKINDLVLPYPEPFELTRSQLSDYTTSANGQLYITKIGDRRRVKLEGLAWSNLSIDTWKSILVEIEKLTGTVTMYDILWGWIQFEVYWGDSTESYTVDPKTNMPTLVKRGKCNIIDTGGSVTFV